jgi:hypothetical protein
MSLQVVGGPAAKSGMSRLTTEHIYFPIKTDQSLDGVSVSLAFLPSSEAKPATEDWVSSDLVDTPGAPTDTPMSIRLLVGPELSAHTLTPASPSGQTYHCWAKLTTGSEVVVRRAGTLMIR